MGVQGQLARVREEDQVRQGDVTVNDSPEYNILPTVGHHPLSSKTFDW